jgi:hypothetical protein
MREEKTAPIMRFGSRVLSSRTCFGISFFGLRNLGSKAPSCGQGSSLVIPGLTRNPVFLGWIPAGVYPVLDTGLE